VTDTKAKHTLVSVVEVRTNGSVQPPITVHDMPMRVEKQGDLTALVFWVIGGTTAVTVLLTDGDKRDLINMLRRK
jgi:hypothetical protein